MTDLRYPVGEFVLPNTCNAAEVAGWTEEIAALPANLKAALSGVAESELDTRYRDGGWTVRQVVHHLADSHINAVVRIKLALTEDQPTVKTYNEALWAELPDMKGPVESSIQLLDGLHERWTALNQSLNEAQLQRMFHHADWGLVRIDQYIAMYAWHCRHHFAHIKGGLARARTT